MSNKPMIEVAYELMSSKKRAVVFSKLWADVSKATGASDSAVAQFYSDLTLDGRFVQLKDNKWDLKCRRSYDESHIDLSKIEIEDEDEESEFNDDDSQDTPIRNEDEY